jgi:hypothetical protein
MHSIIYSLRDSAGVCWYVGKTKTPILRAQEHARKWPHLKLVVLMTRIPDMISGEMERALIFAMSKKGRLLNEKIPKIEPRPSAVCLRQIKKDG